MTDDRDARPGEGEEVEALHRTVLREPIEPTEGREPAPWWLWAIAAIALVVGGYQLGRRGGDFGTTPHQAFREHAAPTSPGPGDAAAPAAGEASPAAGEAPPEVVQAAETPPDGAEVYASVCASCHQPDGNGVPGAFPPLVGSEWVAGPPEVMVRIVLGGLSGPITVAGAQYDGVMPPFADQLSDAEIAAVITYERQMAGVEPAEVSVDVVTGLREEAAARAGPYTATELGGAP